jgi:ABC-type polysaccharide/polyol phosphate export permease
MLLLFSGAYFPPDILPPVVREISLGLPITYWLEGIRRSFEGGVLLLGGTGPLAGTPISPMLAVYDNWQLLGILVVSAVVSTIGSFFFYQWIEHQAKERGMIDRLTGY